MYVIFDRVEIFTA